MATKKMQNDLDAIVRQFARLAGNCKSLSVEQILKHSWYLAGYEYEDKTEELFSETYICAVMPWVSSLVHTVRRSMMVWWALRCRL